MVDNQTILGQPHSLLHMLSFRATTILSSTKGGIPLPNFEAIDHPPYPLATYNCLDRINVLESKCRGLMHVHDQGQCTRMG